MDVGGKTTIYNVLCTMHNDHQFNHTAVIHIPPTRSEKVTVQTQRMEDSLTNQIIVDIARDMFTHDSFGQRDREGLLGRPAIYRSQSGNGRALLFATITGYAYDIYFVAYPGTIACYLVHEQSYGEVLQSEHEDVRNLAVSLWTTWVNKYGRDIVTAGKLTRQNLSIGL
jgi:hypothetical protein